MVFKMNIRKASYLYLGSIAVLLCSIPTALGADEGTWTLDPCPDSAWHNAIFLKDPSPQGTFYDVFDWNSDQLVTYAQENLVPKVAPSIAFAVIALVLLVVFILW